MADNIPRELGLYKFHVIKIISGHVRIRLRQPV